MGDRDGLDWYGDGATTTATHESAWEIEPDSRTLRWLRPRALVAVAVAFVVLCGAAWWFTHPRTFADSGYNTITPVGFGTLVTDVGDRPDTHTPDGSAPVLLTIVDVVADADRATLERVRIDYVVCRHAPRTDRVNTARPADLAILCVEVRAFVPGAQIEVPTSQILAVLTPLDDTPLTIEGFTLSYRDGIRVGRDHLGPRIELNAPGYPDASAP